MMPEPGLDPSGDPPAELVREPAPQEVLEAAEDLEVLLEVLHRWPA